MSMKAYDLVWVEWIDAEHEGGWSSPGEEAEHTIAPCESVGWLIIQNDQFICLCASTSVKHDGTVDEVGNKQYIPRGMIKTFKYLKRKKGTNGKRTRKAKGPYTPPAGSAD